MYGFELRLIQLEQCKKGNATGEVALDFDTRTYNTCTVLFAYSVKSLLKLYCERISVKYR